MPDTPRTYSAIQALFANNSSGDISPQDLRDFVASVPFGAGRVLQRPGGSSDDEFDDASIAGAWTDVHRSSPNPGSWAEKYDQMHYRHTATSTSTDLHALLRSTTISAGDYIETHLTSWVRQNHAAVGLIFSDGTTFNSGNQVVALFYPYGNGGFFRPESKSNFTGASAEGTTQGTVDLEHTYMRLKYESSNTWGMYISIDGFEWYAVQNNLSKTMTPTHMGLVIHHHTAQSAPQVWVEYDYFRYNPANE